MISGRHPLHAKLLGLQELSSDRVLTARAANQPPEAVAGRTNLG
jgi:hypothetical protein